MAFDGVQFVFTHGSGATRQIGTRRFGLRIALFVRVTDESRIAGTFVLVEHVVLAMGVDSASGMTRGRGDR